MTHIVTNGKYLIADKRTSFSAGTGGDGKGIRPGTKRSSFCRDDSTKITIPKDPLYVRKPVKDDEEPERIVALAMSGSHTLTRNHPVNTLLHIGCLRAYTELLNSDALTATEMSILALVENGNVCVVSRIIMGGTKVHWTTTTTTAEQFSKGAYVAIGSGNEKRLLAEVYKKKEITLLDAFYYGSHLDYASTTDYSVYGLDEARLFTTVRPSEEEVKASY